MTDAGDVGTRQVRGSALLVGGRAFGIAINFATQVIIIQYLSPAEFGVLAYALSISIVLSVASTFGTDKAAARFLPISLEEHDTDEFWGMVRLMTATVAAIGVVAIAVFSAAYVFEIPLFSSERDTQLVLVLVSILAVLNAFDALFVSFFAVLASPRSIFIRRYLLGPLFKLVAALIVIAAGGGVRDFALGQVLAAALGLAVCWPLFSRLLAASPDLAHSMLRRSSWPFRKLYGYSSTLLAGDLSFLLRTALVSVVLGLTHASEEVARYDSVLPIARLIEFVLLTFSILFIPNAARLSATGDHERLKRLFDQNTVWVTMLSFPMFALLFIGSPFLPELLFGSEYDQSSGVLALLSVAYFLNAGFGTSLRLIRANGSLATLLRADFAQVIIAGVLVALLVPRFGAPGGAAAVVVMYAAQSAIYTALVERTSSIRAWASTLPIVASAIILCGAAATLRAAVDGGIIVALILVAVVCGIMFTMYGRRLDVDENFPELQRALGRVPGRRSDRDELVDQ